MRWYQGGIAEAVTASKKIGAVFVVYVEGADDKSKQLTDLLNSEEISGQLETENFVAIKVEENSVPHQQFSQIYKQATVPSLFFIGKTGTPLEIVTEPQSPEIFLNTLQKIRESNGTNVAAEQSNNLIKSEQSPGNSEVVCEDGVCTIKPKSQPSTSKTDSDSSSEKHDSSPEKTDLSPDEKVDRVKEILTQKRDAKRAEEEENARVKELERRKVGQDVQKLKRWQQENELKEMMDERNKEKKEQQEARQRVLAQIAQDKAERAARFPNASQTPTTNPAPQASPQLVHRAVNANKARLQFKLPDGTSHMHEFSSSDTLQDIRNYILSNLNLSFHSFTLSTTFPRREFTEADSSETLLSLELVPNAVILILPLHHGTVSTNSSSWIVNMFWSFIGPLLNFVGYLKAKLFGTPAPRSPTPTPKRPNESTGEPSNLPKKRMGDANVVRKQGNVHRLTDKADSDDDNNTWNGNSTQQM